MSISLLRGSFNVVKWSLCGAGAAAFLLTALVAAPLTQPPELHSVSATARAVDRSTMPRFELFQARDGTQLAYRHYQARGDRVDRVAILVHGSSGSSPSIHALGDALAAHGVETYAIDVRGHGASGTRGDIAYVGQLEDDLADFVGVLRKTAPTAPLTLIGHSAGGGFALRVAASPIQNLFARTVLLAPYLGYDAPTNRPDQAWASADIPRILALQAMRRMGVDCCDALPTLAFAVPPKSDNVLVPVYTDRLRRNFGTRGYRTDLAAVTRPLTIFSGADDELMIADKYAEAVHGITPAVDVKLIDGVNHMGIVSTPEAVSAVADDIATRGAAGT